MGLSSVYCSICGTKVAFRSRDDSWRRDFRAIRCDQNSTIDGKPFLTGIGGFVPPTLQDCAAPSDPDARWDGEGVVLSDNDRFPALIGCREFCQPGFLFHEVCWQLLQGMLYPHPVPIERFYDICLSFPASHKGWLDWGHDYDGLMERFPSAGYPWEDVNIVAFVKRHLGEENSPLVFSRSHPLDIPEIEQALADVKGRQSFETSVSDERYISPDFPGAEPDCFRKLPWEILEYIQMLLPSRSVTSVRLASRSFASLKLGQSFWASRFNFHQDRGYCFEAIHPLKSPVSERRGRDWKMLYERTKSKEISSDELRNRKRIWHCLRGLVELLLEKPLTSPGLMRNLLASTSQEEEFLEAKTAWRPVCGDSAMRNPALPLSGIPCRVIYDRIIFISHPIKFLGVSFCNFNGEQYICGLRFVFEAEDEDLLAGYVQPSKEVYLDVHGVLTGFIIATGPRGIKALRAVTRAGHITDWAGSPDDFPQTVRLCMKSPIHTLKVSVDGFKLVCLSVQATISPLFPADSQLEAEATRDAPHLPLRTTGLWYPSIPSLTQNLYPSTFPGRDVSLYEYRPLVHVMFGGRHGSLLKHLTRISVTVSMAAIVGIDFFYDDNAPFPFLQACRSTASADDSVKIPFSVDGPGGEILTGLQGDGDIFLGASHHHGGQKYGAITSLKVTTNHGRSCTFQPSAIPILQLPAGPYVRRKSKKTVIEPGSTLTGIYFMHVSCTRLDRSGFCSISLLTVDLRKLN